MKILILGGTGFVGKALCEALNRQGLHAITVVSRDPSRHKAVAMLPGVTLVSADVHRDDDLQRVMWGQDAVINLIALLQGKPQDFHHVHVELAQRLVRVMQATGVKRLVHVSALGIPDDPQGPMPSHYLRTKYAAEQVLREAAEAHRIELTVLRPSVIFGPEDRFLNLFAGLQRIFPLLPLGSPQAQFQPVWLNDVTLAIARCLNDRGTIGKIYECAGPRVWTLSELVRFAGHAAGARCMAARVIHLPDGLAQLQALMLTWLPGPPLISPDNVNSMRVPNVATGRHGSLRDLGIEPASLEMIAPDYLSRNVNRLDIFRRFAGR